MSTDQLIERWCKDHATPTVQWLVDNFEPAEGSSIRRSILYNFYLEHCLILKIESLNPASFGKLIHSVFLGLKTRRLGTRGNSKYHYYGIQVKSSSSLIKQMSFDGDLLLQQDFDTQSMNFNMSPNDYISSPLSNNLMNSSFDSSFTNEFPSDITTDDIKIFHKTHDEYSNKLYQALIKFQYDSIEKILQQFWSLTNIHFSQTNELTNNAIRTIAMNMSHWFRYAIDHLYEPLKSTLLQYTQIFSSLLLRYTSLNHLSLTIQNMFLQSSRLLTMSNDLTCINFPNLHEQINWLVECDLNLFNKIEQCLKNLFQCQSMLTIENWTTFINTLLDDYLILYNNTPDYLFHARQFLLKTNFYCSLILRELTLHYGTSVGSFHLLQIFIEEYLYYRIEHKLSLYFNQTAMNFMMENFMNKQQNLRRNSTYEDLFNDDDLDDDLESLGEDFHDQRNHLKPLSPVQMEDFILPNETIPNSFSYIFEDLQPLVNEIF
ncbi:hypothetical protein I4U23_021207 [Adineta vaga]|nr:hypothetical protein I4U23_021207 [Adineta vaga]